MGSFDEWVLVQRGLTTAEWKAELHTLQSSSSLDELKLWVDDVDPELLKVRGELLGTEQDSQKSRCGSTLGKLQTIRSLQIRIKSWASSTSAYLSGLVSGLERSPNLRIETLSIDSLRKSSDAIYISEIIRRTTKLQVLTFGECESERLSEDAVESLASSIAEAVQLNLVELGFRDIRTTKGLFELLRKVFPAETDSDRRYLRKLSFKGAYGFPKEGWGLFPVLAGNNISAISIHHYEAPHPL
ncbi:hypothetical protein R1sor_021256 [Riccia sorocarpa]|uniref:Uncharacterized protein n=1 Tax=Riccia sorocarpa TaxID=122646 RepID=A0ABD3GGI6_9MARC